MKKICNHCNIVYDDDELFFCPNCSNRLETYNPNEKVQIQDDIVEKPNNIQHNNNIDIQNTRPRQFNTESSTENTTQTILDYKKIMIGIISLLIVIIITILVVFGISVAKPKRYQNEISVILGERYEVSVFCNNILYDFDISSTMHSYSADNKSYAFIDTENNLWLVNSKGKTQVDTNVSTFVISSNGSSIAYIKQPKTTILDSQSNISSTSGELNLYDVKKKKSTTIDNNAISSANDRLENKNILAISPNGKSISYLKDTSLNDTNSITWKNYIYYNGTTFNFTEDSIPFAINDDISLTYWYNVNEVTIYCGDILENKTLVMTSNPYEKIIFNKDLSECILSTTTDTFILKNGENKQLLGTFHLNNILNGTTSYYNQGKNYIMDVDTFQNCLIDASKNDENKFYYILNNKNIWSCYELNNKNSSYTISADTKYIYAIKDASSSALVKISTTNSNDETQISLNVKSFAISQDEKYIYYITDNNTLYCYDNGKSIQIDSNVNSIYECNNDFYYLKNVDKNNCGTLYCSYNGDEPQPVDNGNNVYSIYTNKSGLLFVSVYNSNNSNLGTLYRVKNRTNSEILHEDIR